eukprot:PhF_6_TR21073/c0_g1_i1/m.30358
MKIPSGSPPTRCVQIKGLWMTCRGSKFCGSRKCMQHTSDCLVEILHRYPVEVKITCLLFCCEGKLDISRNIYCRDLSTWSRFCGNFLSSPCLIFFLFVFLEIFIVEISWHGHVS